MSSPFHTSVFWTLIPRLSAPHFQSSLLSPVLNVFLLYFLTLHCLVKWVLFIYGQALSVCVGLSNILLSCATIIESLVPSYVQGMKDGPRSLLRSPSLNTADSKAVREGGGRAGKLCGAQRAFLHSTKRTNSHCLSFKYMAFLYTYRARGVDFFYPTSSALLVWPRSLF